MVLVSSSPPAGPATPGAVPLATAAALAAFAAFWPAPLVSDSEGTAVLAPLGVGRALCVLHPAASAALSTAIQTRTILCMLQLHWLPCRSRFSFVGFVT